MLSGTMVLSGPIGTLMSRYIYEYGGHLGIWCTTLSCYSLALLWLIFCIRDSRGKGSNLEIAEVNDNKEDAGGFLSIIKNLWQCFTVTFKRRPGNKRTCLAIILTMRCISIFSDGIE